MASRQCHSVLFGLLGVLSLSSGPIAQSPAAFMPGGRVLLDAHNAYPYEERWKDRLDRALRTGTPLAIEQDLVWRPASASAPAQSIVSHGKPFTGNEPTLRDFFERVRPIVTRALTGNSRDQWPLITLNLDFKDSHPEHFVAIWNLLGRYESWLTTAARAADASSVQPLTLGPLLILTGADPAQQLAFHDAVPLGGRLRLFGAVQRAPSGVEGPVTSNVDGPSSFRATNYLRWSNNPWSAVEPEGQPSAGDWSEQDKQRLRSLTTAAHSAGLWIRFYTLNGHPTERSEAEGWSPGYNFGSLQAARIRWSAAIDAGVDFVATDQYEDFSALLKALPQVTEEKQRGR